MPKILITVPDLKLTGGVSIYYKTLRLDRFEQIVYFNVNGGVFKNTFLRLIERNISFFFLIFKFDIIHVNPSLLKNAFLRESVLILLALLFKKKVVVFIRGWNVDFEEEIKSNFYYNQIFKKVWCKVDLYLVLGNVFKNKLKKIGVDKKIVLETTLSAYQGVKGKSIKDKKRIELLFISRLVKEKGIFIALDTMKILQSKYGLNNIHLNVAGDGIIRKELELYVEKESIMNCHLLGNVRGVEKDKLFEKSDIMLFPSYFGEGLPNSILEGMGSGLPIISRINAGIPDQVIHGVNGYLTEGKDPEWFAKTIVELIKSNLFEEISVNNLKKAKKYSIQAVSKRLLKIYDKL